MGSFGTRTTMDIIFDIDGTLLDISHRLKYIKQTPKNWKAFRDPKQKRWDEPIMPVIRIATALMHSPYPPNRIIFASGRSESERVDTVRSLSRWFLLDGWQGIYNPEDFGEGYTLENTPTSPFYLRKDKDYRKDTIVKREMYDHMVADGYKPEMVFDDRPSVIRMWRELGLKTIDVGLGIDF